MVTVGDLVFSLPVQSAQLLLDHVVDSHADEFGEHFGRGGEVLEVVVEEERGVSQHRDELLQHSQTLSHPGCRQP